MSKQRSLRAALGAALYTALTLAAAGAAPAVAELATAPVQVAGATEVPGFDAVIEATRQTVVAAQVSGAVIALDVKVGDVVKAGQVLLRIDARAAEQSAAAGDAQVRTARASLDIAAKELARQQQLLQQGFISQAAFDRAESQFKATEAEVSAQLAQAGVTRTQSGFYVVKAPYAGIVSELPVALGDMAMPGRALLTLYDPRALRATAAVPQSAVARLAADARGAVDPRVEVELPGVPARRVAPQRLRVLPTADPATHTVQVRLDLAEGLANLAPGQFARVWLPLAGDGSPRLYVPAKAVLRRAEMTVVYVVDAGGRPLLRQVRLGRNSGDSVEVLAGVDAGERVALEPQVAARLP